MTRFTQVIYKNFTIGIDEVGRGPIAGPVAVGVFVFLDPKVEKVFRKAKESKQLSEKKREEWFDIIMASQKTGCVDFCVSFQSERVIDDRGLSYAINKALRNSLDIIVRRNKLNSNQIKILLDGGLRAPIQYVNQKTIIKGDEKELSIALASICAKVLRDRKMRSYAKKFIQYGFEIHKGYGTRKHYSALKKHGLTPIHRKSFIRL